MKTHLAKLCIALAAVGLVGCSSNTQNENTTLGAITGAVVGGLTGSLFGQGTGQVIAIGAGAIAGAFVGGYIGKNMDHRDYQNTCNTLNGNAKDQPTTWKNKRTGIAYSVKPTSNYITYNGNNACRRFQTTTTATDGQSKTVNGVACRQSNGTWREVSSS